jgi:hypothetical protein
LPFTGVTLWLLPPVEALMCGVEYTKDMYASTRAIADHLSLLQYSTIGNSAMA